MSDMPQQGAPAAPDAQGGEVPPALGAKPYDIQQCAHDAQTALEKLATELGKSDAPPDTIDAISGYADDCKKIADSFSALREKGTQEQGGRPTMDDATQGLMNDVQQQ